MAGGILFGALFLLIQRDVIIVRWALKHASKGLQDQSKSVSRKNVTCYYWHDNLMRTEHHSLLQVIDNHAENLKNLVACWLMVNQDEYVIDREVNLVCVTLSLFNGEAFLVFSHSLFNKNCSIFKKQHIIESLLKTLRGTIIPIRGIIFFVGEHAMVDEHLDFSCSWPIDGFLLGN